MNLPRLVAVNLHSELLLPSSGETLNTRVSVHIKSSFAPDFLPAMNDNSFAIKRVAWQRHIYPSTCIPFNAYLEQVWHSVGLDDDMSDGRLVRQVPQDTRSVLFGWFDIAIGFQLLGCVEVDDVIDSA